MSADLVALTACALASSIIFLDIDFNNEILPYLIASIKSLNTSLLVLRTQLQSSTVSSRLEASRPSALTDTKLSLILILISRCT